MGSEQIIILVGNLGRDPEMKYTPEGKPITHFSLATNREFMARGEKVKETTWFSVTVMGNQAEPCNQYLAKGSEVLVRGHLTPGKDGTPEIWTGNDGQPRASFNIFAEHVTFLGGMRSQTSITEGDFDPEFE